MKVWCITGFLSTILLEAGESDYGTYGGGYAMPLLVLIFIVFATVIFVLSRKTRQQKEMLLEKEEKITFLRRVNAENEHKYTAKMHEDEKEILSLKHTIETLEKQIKEGTKNQVVQKIELQQRKRENDLNRLGLAD